MLHPVVFHNQLLQVFLVHSVSPLSARKKKKWYSEVSRHAKLAQSNNNQVNNTKKKNSSVTYSYTSISFLVTSPLTYFQVLTNKLCIVTNIQVGEM